MRFQDNKRERKKNNSPGSYIKKEKIEKQKRKSKNKEFISPSFQQLLVLFHFIIRFPRHFISFQPPLVSGMIPPKE